MAVKSVFTRTSTRKTNQIKCNFALMSKIELELIKNKVAKSLQAEIKISKHLNTKGLPVEYDEIINTLHNFKIKDIIELNKDLETGNIKVLIKGNKKVITEHGKKFYLHTFIVYSLTTQSIVTIWIGRDKRNYADNFVRIDIKSLLKNL